MVQYGHMRDIVPAHSGETVAPLDSPKKEESPKNKMPYEWGNPYGMMDTSTHLFNHWSFLVKTDLYHGGQTHQFPQRITMSEEQLRNVEGFILYCINRCMATQWFAGHDTNNNDGLQALEVAVNKVLREQHDKEGAPSIIVDLFPAPRGIEVKVSMMAPAKIIEAIDNIKKIEADNEHRLLR